MKGKNLFNQTVPVVDQNKYTNSLTNSIIRHIEYHKGAAFRVNTTGIPVVVKGKLISWRPSQNAGAADIRAIIDGYSIDIEIKSDTDKLNQNQIVFQKRVTDAGGQYWVVRHFEEYLNYYEYFRKRQQQH